MYPADAPALRTEIDAVDELVYHDINNGAYKAGFGSNDQDKYEAAFNKYFEAWDVLEERLSDGRPFLCGDAVTESDVKVRKRRWEGLGWGRGGQRGC